jgi:hypothetical protein
MAPALILAVVAIWVVGMALGLFDDPPDRH